MLGVWHSLATEKRLKGALDTWGKDAKVVLLGSEVGKKQSAYDVLDTGVKEDNYFSTLGKGLLGLKKMAEIYPDAKWYGVIGDDNYVLVNTLFRHLSAFDPQEDWLAVMLIIV